MNPVEDKDFSTDESDPRLERAAQWFLRVRSESARVEDLPELKRWLEADPRNALAYRQVSATWETVGTHASAPEIMAGRRDALDDARRAAAHRWFSLRPQASGLRTFVIAASLFIAVIAPATWFYSQRGVYATDLGERRTLTLHDGSVVTLDAKSRIRVDYHETQRLVTLKEGQARFDVTKDPNRPFRVKAGGQTVVALGTQFNVELVAGVMLVTMIEGHVAILSTQASGLRPQHSSSPALSPQASALSTLGPIELKGGEGLRVGSDGIAVVLPKIDIVRATAWQSGKLFFDNEPLASAVERVNRYSRQQIGVDPSVADVGISGVFNTGDSAAFIEAVTAYFPVQVQSADSSSIQLTAR